MLMLGLSFIHAGFLAGALAVAVPIAIHLWFRPRPKPVEIGSLWFLKVVVREHSRRRNLRRWVLLMLRIAGVLLLALLFARPFRDTSAAEEDDREVALLIDQSASMARSATNRTPFERAREAAGAVLHALPARAVVHLAYFDDAGVSPVQPIAIDPARRPGLAATDYSLALGWARDVMARSRRGDRRVILFTDLQRSGTARSPFVGWPGGVSLEIVDVGKPVANNLTVTGAEVEGTDIRSGAPVWVSAVVTNTGLFPARDVPVQLNLSGGASPIQATQKATIDAGAREVVRFPIESIRPGLYQGSVEVASTDELALDNRRWLAFEARTTDRVLLLDGDPGSSVYTSETYYLEMALRLRLPGKAPNATATAYEPVHLAWSGRGPGLPDLRNVAVVIACNVASSSASDASAVRDFVWSGGGLVLFGGDKLGPKSFEELRRAGVLPLEYVENAEPGLFWFATWEKDHPLFRALSDPQHGDLRRLEFFRINRLKPSEGSDARVLAASAHGEPLLFESTYGHGKVLVFPLAADRDWGDWPIQRLYLPLVHQVLGYLTGRLAESGHIQALGTGPGREHAPGIEREKTGLIVRNLDPRESDFERISEREFRAAYHLPDSAPTRRTGDEPPPRDPQAHRPDEFWRVVVLGLFAVLVVETFVANRTRV
jgi:hypothetical protein